MRAQQSAIFPLRQLSSRERLFVVIGILLVVLLLLLFLTNDCQIVEGARYRSPKEIDNIVGGTMHPQVSFNKGQFTWVITDIVIVGTYECKLGKLHAYASYNSSEEPVRLDTLRGILWWNGEPYFRIPPNDQGT